MTAPTLVLLGPGSHDPRTPEISRQIGSGLRALRPNLDVHAAYLDVTGPTAHEVVARLAAEGVEEVVLVPLLLSDAFGVKEEVPALVAELNATVEGVRVGASRPIGPEAQLLSIVDRRLKDALRARHVAVGSWYLSPGLLWTSEAEAALEAGATAVSAPMGSEPEIVEVALARYVVAAMELVDVDTPVPYETAAFDEGSYEPAAYDDAFEDGFDAEELEELPQRHLSVVSA